MRRKNPTPAAIAAALEFQSIDPPRMARAWLIHWLTIAPTIKRYQVPVLLSRVLSEHAAAVAAEPIQEIER